MGGFATASTATNEGVRLFLAWGQGREVYVVSMTSTTQSPSTPPDPATDPALGTEKWSAGPAVAGLVQRGKLLAGLIVLSNFSFAGKSDRDDVRTMAIQPFGSYGLAGGWSLELSEMAAAYNFESGKWGSLPLGARIGKMAAFGDLPVRFYADAEYNFANDVVAPEWTFRFAVVPLI
jgi:hypothetical protein